jgi:ABC-type transport system substrate-binding protein
VSSDEQAGTTSTTSPKSSSGTTLAARDLSAAGWHRRAGRWVDRRGRQLSLVLATPTDDAWALSAAGAIQTQLGRNGISVRVVDVGSAPQVASLLRSGRVDLGVLARPTDPFPSHAVAWFNVPRTGPASSLWSGYRDAVIAQSARAADQVLNADTAAPMYEAINQRLWSTMPSLPLYTEPVVTAWSSSLGGVLDNPYPPGTLDEAPSWVINADATVQTLPPTTR